ncbi:MAG: U32 family peptidase [Erysipelotrichaceae bacterium]|nr:U32 family peptidase [Erysipelotrichaceae bacterium]
MNLITTPYHIEDLEKLKEAGADSVIVSNPFFSARGAAYEDVEKLWEYKKECKRLGLFLYVQVNRFFIEEELEQLRVHLKLLKEVDVDGIYFGDEAVLQEAQVLGIEDKLIYNPDTLITNAMDVQYYLEEGIQSVCLSREITLEEICEIVKKCDPKKVEVMIHGRMNMMHSKRALISNYLSFCNKEHDVKNNHDLYIIENTREDRMPILEDDLGTHVFTGFTLASFEEYSTLCEAGIENMRIDGIFQDIDTLCKIVRDYKVIFNGEKQASAVWEEYQKEYPQANYTKGFYYTKTSKTR